MPGFVSGKKVYAEPNSCSSDLAMPNAAKRISCTVSSCCEDKYSPILPGLPDDVAKQCLALVPRPDISSMAAVCKKWRSFLKSKEFLITRKLAGMREQWIYIYSVDAEKKKCQWEVLDCSGNKQQQPPPMPSPVKASFGMAVLDGKLLVVGGYAVAKGTCSASPEVYQYDSLLNSWSKLADMNVARYDFACAEVNGMVYAVGGHGIRGENLSSAEFYNPETNKWTMIESLRRPRWGCFGYGLDKKLYIMGGRSSFTIGSSRSVDVYDIERQKWDEMKNGCVMIMAHAVIGRNLFCLQWTKERKLAVYKSEENTWITVPIPVTGSSSIEFRFGILDGKLLLFSHKNAPWYSTLLYDPDAAEWRTSKIKPSGLCLCSVTIQA